jgi:hypothetical protein
LTWLCLSVLFYVRALKGYREDAAAPPGENWQPELLKRNVVLRNALLGSVCGALMFLTRQTGIFLPLAFGAIVLLRMPRRQWFRWLVAGCAPALGVIALYFLLNRESTGNWATQNITLNLTLQQLTQPEWWGIFTRRIVQGLMTIGLYLTPLWLGLLLGIKRRPAFSSGRHSRLLWLVQQHDEIAPYTFSVAPRNAGKRAGLTPQSHVVALPVYGALVLVFAIAIARLAARGEWFPYLTDILTRAGMRPYLAYVAWDAGALRPDIFPQWLLIGLTLFAGAAGLGLALLIVNRVPRQLARAESTELQFIWILMVLIAGASFLFATFYERYLLPLLFGAILLMLDTARTTRFSLRAAAVGLVLVALGSWVLMQDYWSWNEARWRVGRDLLGQDIPAYKIDGGYEWDGWYLYDATLEYTRKTGKPIIIDPWQYVLDPEYVLAFEPMPHYRIQRAVEFSTLFSNRQFYLLHRE